MHYFVIFLLIKSVEEDLVCTSGSLPTVFSSVLCFYCKEAYHMMVLMYIFRISVLENLLVTGFVLYDF